MGDLKRSTFLLSTLLIISTVSHAKAEGAEQPVMKVELSGKCRSAFPFDSIIFGRRPTELPASPFNRISAGSCKMEIHLVDRTTKTRLAGIPIRLDKIISYDPHSSTLQTAAVETLTTDANGRAEFRFRWDPAVCSYALNPYRDEGSQQSIMTPPTFLTAKGLFEEGGCEATFFPYDEHFWGY